MKQHSFNYLVKTYLRKKLQLGLLFSLLFSIHSAFATDTILFLGDSISAGYGMEQHEGWVPLLNRQLKDKKAPYKILNASISGETTSGGLSRLPALLDQNKVNYLFIELGGNDGLRGYNPKKIKNNLLQMIELAKQKELIVFLMHINITPNYGPRYNQMFEQVFIDVAKQENITLVPFFMNDIALKKELMQDDGIHPNKSAQPFIADIVEKQLTQLIP
ncbi:MAG: arylesterase [Colwellia sp.]